MENLKQFSITSDEIKYDSTSPADGSITSIDVLFKQNLTKIKFEKQQNSKKIKVDMNGIITQTNDKTMKYILEGMIFFGIIKFEEAEEHRGLGGFNNFCLNNGIEFIKEEFGIYNSLQEYIKENKEYVLGNINKNIDHRWNGKLFFRKILIGSLLSKESKPPFKNDKKKKIEYTYSDVYDLLFSNKNIILKNVPQFLLLKNLKQISIEVTEQEKQKIKGLLNDKEALNNHKKIRSLRRLFKQKLVSQVIEDYKETMNENILLDKFPVWEGAHIVSVKNLIAQDRIDEISNHNNGFLIDPNLHKLFDKNKVELFYGDDSLEFLMGDKLQGRISLCKISPQRKKWINEYLEAQK